MNIRLFNTMSRKLEDFQPLIPGHVGFYSCGPTVYHYTHIGNLRSFVLADLLKRMFLENGYEVFNVMNITDVGHLTSEDDDSGEDKAAKKAKDWALADQLRAQIDAAGWIVQDTKDGAKIVKKI